MAPIQSQASMVHFVTPVTVLTGFLGAGKTTLVNRLLKETHGKRFVVIENEFGDVSIDDDLIYREAVETIVQLSNGCLCCRVRGDLARALGELAQRKERGELEFDHVLIEASGLADPGPIIQTFLAETMLLTRYALDAVVSLVDAANVGKAITAARESLAQIALADWILVTKADRLDERGLDEVVRRVREINPQAPLRSIDLTTGLPDEVFDGLLSVRGYEFDRVKIGDPAPVGKSAFVAEEANHTHDVSAISFRTHRPLDVRRTQETFAMMRSRFGDRIWRIKGVLALATYPKRVVIQGVQELLQVTDGVVWRPYEKRESKIVVIGVGLDRDAVLNAFESCVVNPEHAGVG